MNSFGRLFRISLFGESHGEKIGVVIDGCPPGLSLSPEDFALDLGRRKPGKAGTTARQEPDTPLIISGLFQQKTSGSPLTILYTNKDIQSRDYLAIKDIPRPGHADFVAHHKYQGFHDFRGGGHFSGRLTAPLVTAGVVAKKILSPVVIKACLREAGGSTEIDEAVQTAVKAKNSIGGIIECRTQGIPVGWGEPFFDSVESLISHIIFAIPGIKGIEFGSGFSCSRMTGNVCNDAILDSSGRTQSNHAGGINGGISNGNEIIFRIAVKPTSSIGKEQNSINLKTGKQVKLVVKGRHDACIALRMPVIIEAAAAIALVDLKLQQKTLFT